MNEPLTPEQFAELKEELQRQLRELSEEDFAALSQNREDAWNALSRQEQQRLREQRSKGSRRRQRQHEGPVITPLVSELADRAETCTGTLQLAAGRHARCSATS